MASPGPSPNDIQTHLYKSFLEGRTADVILRVKGCWHALYKLHRVVLIQSGFFQSLFTGAFVESVHKFRASGHNSRADEVEIVFDDPNITRPGAICIARLYGGGPALHISPSLLPSPSNPLTASFPCPPNPSAHPTPTGQHPATPPFLLSLLATAVYLAIPSVAAQALTMILNSVGPYTVMRYLGFAIGCGIGGTEEVEALSEGAVGLETVAEMIKDEDPEEDEEPSKPPPLSPSPAKHEDDAETPDDIAKNLDYMEVKKEDPADISSSSSSSSQEDLPSGAQPDADEGPSYYYGAVSAKVGEACACWLARWGRDMFAYEEKVADGKAAQPAPAPARRRATTVSADVVVPVIWRRGGLEPAWVKALIMSDFLFVSGERERYDLAKGVVEMRRRQLGGEGLDEREEAEWEDMFSQGIFYANMLLEDLMEISNDVSPTTGRPYVPIQVLQAALWSQSVLRHHITARPSQGSSSPPSSPTGQRDKELGITLTTADILRSATAADMDKSYFPIPADSSVRIGDTSALENASMDELFAAPAAEPADPKKVSRLSTSERTFFGLLSSSSQRRPVSACVLQDPTGKARWSRFPPFRFGVEFWDVDELKEKSRLHSQTVWYAGSLFNVYVQVVRKKGVPGVQLGVYLHRQSSVDPVPPRSAPSPLALGLRVAEREREHGSGHNRRISAPSANAGVHASTSLPSIGSPLSRSTTPVSAGSPFSSSSLPGSPGASLATSSSSSSYTNTIPATSAPVAPPQPYRDPRSAISAYFTISCASATGASLTQFTSAPDVFSVSQSWGWKSSSLRTEEYLEVGADQGRRAMGREVSLRATVVLGLV
ncbi:hypothetical protein GLOTRDRAFT_53870 [Gloeophyllum trabeum ATCC 11539]|uniref:BTB domain-containing protein n=1 Tax=Gloeophyllum trabeum (strain ATCC 11539 / FP-39264 / Madison 617) TaxID=670483 RepID=S7S137_GLOTA|nr:uncharacterized protein GLOTRDRAFT_53870 [Gloeophyllum trabeum ATCC 11539]EPQ61110.1 hypothetical protein GLOTRDRAFT_53870 [Gloeophyllum trabeum ATCC 11539]